jgi:hypothetical protein
MASNDRRDEEQAEGAEGRAAGGGPGAGEGPGGGRAAGGESEASGGRTVGGESEADALGRLEERLSRASEAAERLFAEAGAAVRGPRTPPPSGWQVPEPEGSQRESRRGVGELESLLSALGSLRELIPPDLQRRLTDALRELLLALRALIDWYLERSQRIRAQPSDVQDIPIS